MLGAAIGGTLCAASALMTYAVRGRSATFFGPSVYQGTPARRSVALTFDDGPSEGTLPLLDLLGQYHVPATFFQCGLNVERLPEIARLVHAAGHEIGNHSHTHPRFYFRSASFIDAEWSRAQEAIEQTTGFSPSLLRAPFGIRWFGFRKMQRRLKLLGVMWTAAGLDWKLPSDAIVSRVLRAIRNGAIICLHDGRELQAKPDIGETLEAVRRLIPMLQARGFQFETVTQLLCPTT